MFSDKLNEALKGGWKAYARNRIIPGEQKAAADKARFKAQTDREAKQVREDPGAALKLMISRAGGRFWSAPGGLWFVPIEVQRNGGAKGLMLDLGFSGKPKIKSVNKNEIPGGRHAFWKAKEPDDEIVAYFEKHSKFS